MSKKKREHILFDQMNRTKETIPFPKRNREMIVPSNFNLNRTLKNNGAYLHNTTTAINQPQIHIRMAQPTDIKLLTKLRIEVLRAANQLPEDVDLSNVETETQSYYEYHFVGDQHITLLAYFDDTLAGCGSICFNTRMPTYHNPSGRHAYIMNMYTHPQYRRKGIAYNILDQLVHEAYHYGYRNISLEATPQGRPLYEKYGFVPLQEEMILAKHIPTNLT